LKMETDKIPGGTAESGPTGLRKLLGPRAGETNLQEIHKKGSKDKTHWPGLGGRHRLRGVNRGQKDPALRGIDRKNFGKKKQGMFLGWLGFVTAPKATKKIKTKHPSGQIRKRGSSKGP